MAGIVPPAQPEFPGEVPPDRWRGDPVDGPTASDRESLVSARAETPPKDVLDLVDRQIRLIASGYWTWGTTCKILVIVLFIGCFLAGLPHVAGLFRALAR